MNTNFIPFGFPCSRCGDYCETGLHSKKYQGGFGKKFLMTSCCLAPFCAICHSESDDCLFCPGQQPNAFRILKRRIGRTLRGSNTNVRFDNWADYTDSLNHYVEASSVMPRLLEFLIWAAENRPDVQIRWFNLHQSSIRALYQVFQNDSSQR